MKTIKLINSSNGWLARFSDPEIIEAFGTDTIPTPFTESALPMTVKSKIEELNPGYYVTFA